jgi:hypothetical protein
MNGMSLDVPLDVIARLRDICLALPDAREEAAWVGTRWRVRDRTFAHVLGVVDGHPPGYARALGADGPALLLMFRALGDELDALRHIGPPFFAPPWRRDEVGLVLGPSVDWSEVGELLTESYCAQAPATLAQLVRDR